MIQIIIMDNQTKIQTNDVQLFIEGSFEIKKEGDKAPMIKVVSV